MTERTDTPRRTVTPDRINELLRSARRNVAHYFDQGPCRGPLNGCAACDLDALRAEPVSPRDDWLLWDAVVATVKRDDLCDETEGEHHTDEYVGYAILAIEAEAAAGQSSETPSPRDEGLRERIADALWRELMKAGYDRRFFVRNGEAHTRADAAGYAEAIVAALAGTDDT